MKTLQDKIKREEEAITFCEAKERARRKLEEKFISSGTCQSSTYSDVPVVGVRNSWT
jgi:hypothetical protein